jgi:hypothetical protein
MWKSRVGAQQSSRGLTDRAFSCEQGRRQGSRGPRRSMLIGYQVEWRRALLDSCKAVLGGAAHGPPTCGREWARPLGVRNSL